MKRLGHKCGALMNGIRGPNKKDSKEPLKDTANKEEGLWFTRTLVLDLSFRNQEQINFCWLSHSVHSMFCYSSQKWPG